MRRKKILLVEDSPLPQKIAEAILQQLNCCVDSASTGEEAVKLFANHHYDLILMDIGLPGIDGIKAAQLIRDHEKGKHHVPIIALTAHDDSNLKTKVLAAGMNDYLIKPLTASLVKKVIIQYC